MTFKILLALGLYAPAWGAVNILKVGQTPNKLIVDYVAPTQAACTLEVADMNLPMRITSATGDGTTVIVETAHLQHNRAVGNRIYVDSNGPSQWQGWQTITAVDAGGTSFSFLNSTAGSATSGTVGYLVNDVNPNLYTNANNDLARPSTLNQGKFRTVTLGKDYSQVALTGKSFSRGLQADSRHIVTITCGSDVGEKDTKTANVPLGGGGTVMPPRPYPNPGDPGMPFWDPRCQQERPNYVAFDPVIEPVSGILHTNGQVCGEYPEIRDILPTTVYPETVQDTVYSTVIGGTGWTNPNNILTQDSTYTTVTNTGGTLCVRPRYLQMLNPTDNLPTYGVDGHSIDSVQINLVGASTSGTLQPEVNLSFDGCATAWFPTWQTLTLTGSPSTVVFPTIGGSGYPKGGFGDWDSTYANYPTRVQGISLRNDNGVADGTTVFRLPANGEGSYIGFFHPTNAGAPVLLGGSGGDAQGCLPSGGTSGTLNTIVSVDSPKQVTLSSPVGCAVSSITAGTPGTVTCTNPHGIPAVSGKQIVLSGALGVTGATGTFEITVTGANTFTLNGSTVTGSYSGGATALAPGFFWCVPQPAWMVRPKSTGTGTISIDYLKVKMYSSVTQQPDSGGGRNRGTPAPILDYYGNSGHVIQFELNGLHWVSDENGETRRVGSVNFFGRTGVWNAGSCGQSGNSFLASKPESLLCSMHSPIDNHVVPVLFDIKWSGPTRWQPRLVANAAWSECVDPNVPDPNPCAVGTPLIDGSGYTLQDLLVNFDPTFVSAKYPNCGIGEPIGDVARLSCGAGNQDSLGWLGVIDITKPIANYNPANPATNPVIALIGPSTVGMMFNVLHSNALVSASSMYVGQKPGRTPESNAWFAGDGPFKMNPIADMDTSVHACPSNYHNYVNCSTVQVKVEPFDPDPWGISTGEPGEYGTYSVDGTLQLFPCMSYGSYGWSCVNAKATYPTSSTDTEMVRVVSKSGTPPLITYEVARDVTNVGIKNWSTFDTCGITGITAASPGVVTCGKSHGLYTGQSVTISGSFGMTGATGTFIIDRLSTTTFSLRGSTTTGTFSLGTASLVAPMPVCWVKGVTVGNPTTIDCFNATGLTTGDSVTLTGIGGITGGINATHSVTVTGPKTFTIPISTSGTITTTQVCAITELRYNQAGNIFGYTCPTNPGLAAGAGAIVTGLSAQGAPDGSGYQIAICDGNCNGSGPEENRGWLMGSVSNGTTWTSGGTLSTVGVGTIPIRAMLMTSHLAESDTNPPDAPGVWEFLASPHGTTNASITSPLLTRYYGYPNYGMSHIGCNPLGGPGGCAGTGDIGFMAYTPYTGAQILAPLPSIFSRNTYAFFLGKPALAFPNTTEVYVSTGNVDCGTYPWCKQSLNSSPTPYHLPGNGEAGVWTRVAGTSYVYRWRTFAQGLNDGVRWPYFTWKDQWIAAFQGYKPLKNVSGPSTLLTDNLSDKGKHCTATKAGECYTGSQAYDQYVVTDQANTVYADDGNYYCSPIGAKDNLTICAYPWHWLANMGVRYNWGLTTNLRGGLDYQSLGHSFMHNTAGGYGQVPKIYPTGKWFGPLTEIFGPDRLRTKAFYAKIPIVPDYDGLNRLSWIPYTVPLRGPAGTAYARIEYGYDTFSDFNAGQFRCGDYQSNCLATATDIPKTYDALDGIPSGANLVADYYVVSSINPTTINFPSGHKIATGTKAIVAGYGNVILTSVDATHVSIDNSTVNCTVSTITAGNPVSVTCTGTHGMPTGTQVKVSSSGMNGVDGNWFITSTGATTFTLDYSNGSGSYGGMGTVTSVLTVGANPSVGWYRQDSPYQWASESCTITGVTNTTPPEVTCADNHNWQTGSTVTITGVGSGINGVWPIEYTGLATFKLTGATASGTFSSGTATPGMVPCASGCKVTIPALSARTLGFRPAYYDSSGRLIAYGQTKIEATQ